MQYVIVDGAGEVLGFSMVKASAEARAQDAADAHECEVYLRDTLAETATAFRPAQVG